MNDYKEYINKCIFNGKTSLGPTDYLSESARRNLYLLVMKEYEKVSALSENYDSEEILSIITKVSKIENDLKEFAEKACSDWIIKLFDIPESTINIEMNLVQTVDNSNIRVTPESIKLPDNVDHDYFIGEVSKRRLLLSISSGAALILSSKDKWFDIFSKISSKLPSLYRQIVRLRFLKVYAPEKKYSLSGSSFTTVFLTTDENKPEIRCDATCSPLLIEATIKSLFELAISSGLPNNGEISNMVLGKTDFTLADKWDLMIGIPLWKKIFSKIKSCGYNINQIGVNFFLMELSKTYYKDLFEFIDELLNDDEKSDVFIKKICSEIVSKKEQDDFNDFVELANNKFPINDGYITSDELWTESFQ